MTTIIKVDVLFNISEERELAKQFKESNPDFLELKTSGSDGVHFRYTEIQVSKKEHNEVDPKMFYGVYEKEKDVADDIDSTNERIDELEATVEQLLSGLEQEKDARERLEKEVNELKKAMWDRFDIVDGDILRISREVSDQRKSINNLDFKNGEYDAQILNLTDEQNNLGIRLSLAEKKVGVLAQHCKIIFTE